MPWDALPSYVGAGVLFLLGLIAPSIKTVTDQLVASIFRKREKKTGIIETRADAAADACLKDLSLVKDAIRGYAELHRAALERDQIQDREAARRRLEDAIATLSAHSALLPSTLRTSIAGLLPIFRYAHELPYERYRKEHRFGWHPDSTSKIIDNTARYASELLSAYLRRENAPAKPDVICEYELALEDRDGELSDEFAQEIQEQEDELAKFRTGHGLPSRRKPWGS
jgi:hypothetical protein